VVCQGHRLAQAGALTDSCARCVRRRSAGTSAVSSQPACLTRGPGARFGGIWFTIGSSGTWPVGFLGSAATDSTLTSSAYISLADPGMARPGLDPSVRS